MVGQLAAGHVVNGQGKEGEIIRRKVNGMVVLIGANWVFLIAYFVLTVGWVPVNFPSFSLRYLAESSHFGPFLSSGQFLRQNSYPYPVGYEGV